MEFTVTGGFSFFVTALYVAERNHLWPAVAGPAGMARTTARGADRCQRHFAQGIPGAAVATLALPLVVAAATLGADIGGFGLGHRQKDRKSTRLNSNT